MKGQFRIINEMLIFGIGIFLVVFVAQNFQAIQGPVSKISMQDQLTEVSDTISTAVIKAYTTGPGSSVKIRLPSRISETAYSIKIQDNKLLVQSQRDASISVTNELFKIGGTYFNIIAENGLSGSAGYIKITFDGSKIEIKGV